MRAPSIQPDGQPDETRAVRVTRSRRPLASVVIVVALLAGLVGAGVLGRLEEATALTTTPSAPPPLATSSPPPTLDRLSVPPSRVPGLGVDGISPPTGSLTQMPLAWGADLNTLAAAGHRVYYAVQGGSVIRLVDPVYSHLDLPLARLQPGHRAIQLAAVGDWLAWVETWIPADASADAPAACPGGSSTAVAWSVVLANVVTGEGGPVLLQQTSRTGPRSARCGAGSGPPRIALSADAYAYTVSTAGPDGAGPEIVEVCSLLDGSLLWSAKPGLLVDHLELVGTDTLAVVGFAPGERPRESPATVAILRQDAPGTPIVALPTDGGVALSADTSTLLFDGPAVPGSLPGVPGSRQSAVWSVTLTGTVDGPRRLAPARVASRGSAAELPQTGANGAGADVMLWREGTPDGTDYAVVGSSSGVARAVLGVPGPLWASVQEPWAFWVGIEGRDEPVLLALRLPEAGV